jgi:hypothetical protein
MKKSLGIGLMVLVMSLVLAISAFGAERLIVQDTGNNTKFVVNENGQVGIGTATPDPKTLLHGNAGASNATIRLDSGSGVTHPGAGFFYMSSNWDTDRTTLSVNAYYDGASWNFMQPSKPSWLFQLRTAVTEDSHNQDDYVINRAAAGTQLFLPMLIVKGNGNVGFGVSSPSYPLQMASGARCTTGGAWQNASSREYKENIKELSTKDALLAFNKLDPVTFNYKVDKNDKHVGFIAEDVPALVATPDRKALSTMDIVAVLTKVVQQQQKTISELTEKVKKLEEQIK